MKFLDLLAFGKNAVQTTRQETSFNIEKMATSKTNSETYGAVSRGERNLQQ